MALGSSTRGQIESTHQVHIVGNDSVTEDFIPERRLWTAVIVNAVEERTSGSLRSRRAAQHSLFEDDDEFNRVCSCTGLDPGSLRSKLPKLGRQIEMHGPLARPLAA